MSPFLRPAKQSDRARSFAKCRQFPVAMCQLGTQLLGYNVIVIGECCELCQLCAKGANLSLKRGHSLDPCHVSTAAATTKTPNAVSDIGIVSVHRVAGYARQITQGGYCWAFCAWLGARSQLRERIRKSLLRRQGSPVLSSRALHGSPRDLHVCMERNSDRASSSRARAILRVWVGSLGSLSSRS